VRSELKIHGLTSLLIPLFSLLKEMKHKKHAAITRPSFGKFSRNEWAIIGIPCIKIQHLAKQIISQLSQNWKLAYVDADHTSSDEEAKNGGDLNSMLTYGAFLEYTDKITHHRFDSKGEMEQFQICPRFNEVDAVIVNGNHFKAKAQVVVIDSKKEDSLRRKLDQLTDVQLILLAEGMETPFKFLRNEIENIDSIPTFRLEDAASIISFFEEKMKAAQPKLNGLVLVGGKSQRMGKDKGLLDYHGQPQRLHMAAPRPTFPIVIPN